MIDVRVDAAVAQQAEEMQLALSAALHGLLEERDLVQLLISDHQVDAGDVHVDDAARADIHVADFAVAHLAFGEADEWAGGLDQRVGKLAQQLVIGGLARKGDRVALRLRAVAPSIEHSQYAWFRSLCHGFSGPIPFQRRVRASAAERSPT